MKTESSALAVAAQPFSAVQAAIARQFAGMVSSGKLLRVDVDKDLMWQLWLDSFRPEHNPIYKARTEHDCTCCRHFIRTMGGVVTIIDGEVVSLWDVEVPERYRPSVEALEALVKSSPIVEPFLYTERSVGVAKTFQQLLATTEHPAGVVTWDHFHVNLPAEYVCKGTDIGPRNSEARGTFDSMLRSLQEITLDSVDTVLELIAQNSLYRGEEHLYALREFRKLKAASVQQPTAPARRDHVAELFCWSRLKDTPGQVAKMRSTMIGTLLTDLSEGKDLEQAVGAFESKAAPANYRRPTALVTKAMIEKARVKVEELGYTTALERRYAVLEDVPINDVLWADREARKAMKKGRLGAAAVFETLSEQVADRVSNYDKVEEIPIEKFLADVLPMAQQLEVMFENRHLGNLVSLVAPVDPTALSMFKWPSKFPGATMVKWLTL